MGSFKRFYYKLNNRRKFPLIRVYSYYKKDFWGLIRKGRLFDSKRVVYNILKSKWRFYKYMLNSVFLGVKYFNKRYQYRANLFLVKRRLQLFYGNLKDGYFSKLGKFFLKRKCTITYFFMLLELRLDVFLIRCFFAKTPRVSRLMILGGFVFVNNVRIFDSTYRLMVADLVSFRYWPSSYEFLWRKYPFSVDVFNSYVLFFYLLYDFYEIRV